LDGAHPLRPLKTTRAQINFDMIGRDEKASPQTDGLIEIPADTTNRLNLIGALYSPSYDRVVKEEDKLVGLTLDDRFDHESALNVFLSVGPVSVCAEEYSGVLVVYGISSGLSPYDGHGGEDRFCEDDEDSAAGLPDGVAVWDGREDAGVCGESEGKQVSELVPPKRR
jgi:hypothetical protein